MIIIVIRSDQIMSGQIRSDQMMYGFFPSHVSASTVAEKVEKPDITWEGGEHRVRVALVGWVLGRLRGVSRAGLQYQYHP